MAVSTGVMGDFTLGQANTDISTSTYRAVRLDTVTGNVVVCGAGERAVGVLQNKPKAGEGCAVRTRGTSKVVVDGNAGAISIGSFLIADANGKGVASAADGDEVFAIAMAASTADGDIIEAALVNRQV